ncbi:hypothetical protein QQ045_029638 [Rhodiola kirilowii]
MALLSLKSLKEVSQSLLLLKFQPCLVRTIGLMSLKVVRTQSFLEEIRRKECPPMEPIETKGQTALIVTCKDIQGKTCYKIHGYPLGHKMHNGSQQKSSRTMANNSVTNVTDAGTSSGENNNQLDVIQEQLKKFFNMMHKSDNSSSSANHTYVAGM